MTGQGCLIGVGVGPGDPDLITIKAARAIGESAVIAFVAADGRASFARRIAARHIHPAQREIEIALPMREDPAIAGAAYDEGALRIAHELERGLDVALLCEGDPLLYGSFIGFLERLGTRFPCRVIPGVTSISAAAAAARVPLASRQAPLTVLPATLPEASIEERLRLIEAAAILKVGRHLGKVRDVLRRTGALDRALLVERAGLRDERVMPLASVDQETAPYFSLVLVTERSACR